MRRVNFLYFIVLLAFGPAVDRLLSVGTKSSPWFLLALPLYIGWIFFSPFLLYWFRKRRPMKRTFACSLMCELEWGVLFTQSPLRSVHPP